MKTAPESVNVLLIDEGLARAEPLRRLLAESRAPSYRVRAVGSLHEGIKALADEPFDIVFAALTGADGGARLPQLRAAVQERSLIVSDLRDAQRIGRMGSWRVELPEGVWTWSSELYRLVGLAPEDPSQPGPSLLEYVHPDDRERVETAFERARLGNPFELECRVIADDGSHRSLNVIGRPDSERDDLVLGTAQDVTELRAVERALRRSRSELVAQRELLAGVLDHAPIGMGIAETDGRFLRVNRALSEILGYSEWELLRLSLEDIVHPDDAATTRAEIAALLAGETARLHSEMHLRHRDGHATWGELSASLIRDEDGHPLRVIVQLADISERKGIERALREERDRTAAIMAAMGEGYLLTVGNHIVEVNDALCAITGFSRKELVGASLPWPFWPPELRGEYRILRDRILADNGGSLERPLQRRDGSQFDAEITVRAALQPDGTPLGWVSTVRDVSDRRRYEAELERLAAHDPLTGLANHRFFHERLAKEMANAVRHGRPLSVAVLDLDEFKSINDRFGHVVGDNTLIAVAQRLLTVVREGELLARVGGEEFAWILPDAEATGALIAAERARRAIGDRHMSPIGRLTISIGVASRGQLDDPAVIFKHADEALYRAKREGRDRTIAWDPDAVSVVASPQIDG
jgi:diguanylate cyclase (GGDEF)-like protein/PAS domain S-box-containing protein